MDWSNERYIRVFTRDTPTILLWPWEVASLWWSFLRKVDRAGVLELGNAEPAQMLAIVLRTATTPPVELVRTALSYWLDSGAAVMVKDGKGTVLLVPNFIEAQEAAQSDAARQRKSRQARRDTLRVTKRDVSAAVESPPSVVTTGNVDDAIRDAAVTSRDSSVTPGHDASHHVTLSQTSQTSQTSRARPASRPCEAPPAPVLENSAAPFGDREGTILQALRSHRPLARLATEERAKTLDLYAYHRGKPLALVVDTLIDVAAKAKDEWSDDHLWSFLLGCVKRAKRSYDEVMGDHHQHADGEDISLPVPKPPPPGYVPGRPRGYVPAQAVIDHDELSRICAEYGLDDGEPPDPDGGSGNGNHDSGAGNGPPTRSQLGEALAQPQGPAGALKANLAQKRATG